MELAPPPIPIGISTFSLCFNANEEQEAEREDEDALEPSNNRDLSEKKDSDLMVQETSSFDAVDGVYFSHNRVR